ncbi:MAG: AAA family ATPase [Muribaculaceae bacterium]|nr:AAA family ATPase [Muribaculaceae bacterium]
MTFAFTSSQLTALQVFEDFLKNDNQVLLLRGAAGTGKTTLLKEFIAILKRGNRSFGLMAPTGRAAHIISEKAGADASTIHRYIYAMEKLRANNITKDKEESDTLHFSFALRENPGEKDFIYLIDEASMISDRFIDNELFMFGSGFLLSDIFQYAEGRKMVFIGDYAQLPPVGMNFSPALDKNYIIEKFKCGVSEITLTEVMRQGSESVLLENATKLRDKIDSKRFIEFRLTPGSNFHSAEVDLLDPYYSLADNAPSPRGTIITHTNRIALEYNKQVREHYFGSEAYKVETGDLLLIARNNYNYGCELFNGTIVKVLAAQPDNEVEKKTVHIKLGREKYKDVQLSFRNVTFVFRNKNEVVQLSVKILDNFLEDPEGQLDGDVLRALVVDFEMRLPLEIKSNMTEIKKFLRSGKTCDSRIKELAEAYKHRLLNDPYYNAVICKYGYAMTCHKAQGGEWPNIFVDLFRFGGNRNEDYFRWAYTALTRSSSNLWFFRAPEFDYISDLTVPEIQLSSKVRVQIFGENSDFTERRFERIKELAEYLGLSVSQDLSKQNQQIIAFSNTNHLNCKIQMWYGNEGYNSLTGKVSCSSGDEMFDGQCMDIIRDSFAPDKIDIPLGFEERPFFAKLAHHVKEIAEQTDIKLLNINHEQYQDVFHLQTDGIAKVTFFYDKNGKYSLMQSISSLGKEDSKLVAFRKEFI